MNIYDGALFAIQPTKAKIFNWVLNTSLKLSKYFTSLLEFDLARLLEDFLPVL